MSVEMLAGVFVYCTEFHSGQGSRLYRLQSRIRMRLSESAWKAIRRGRDDHNNEWEASRRVYRHLKRRRAQ